MIFILGVAERFEIFGVTPWAATVLWRPHAYCIENERICQVRAGRADALDLDAMLPGVAKVVEISEGLSPGVRQNLSESGLNRCRQRLNYYRFVLRRLHLHIRLRHRHRHHG